MATCKECLHFEVCRANGNVFSHIIGGHDVASDICPHFKDKAKYIEQKHSQWDKNGYCSCGFWTCYCGDYDYCPKCCAKMDLKEK